MFNSFMVVNNLLLIKQTNRCKYSFFLAYVCKVNNLKN